MVTFRYAALSFGLLFSFLPAFGQFVPNRYTVLLEDAPVSARFAGREQVRTPAAAQYRQQVERAQAAMAGRLAARNIQVTGSVSTLLNAVFVVAPDARVEELRAMPGVAAVRPMRRYRASLNQAVKLMNAPAAWVALGGQGNAGKGVKIGVIDSGIDQTHPAFQDSTLEMPPGFPKCTDGHPEDCAYTNRKVIVARSYVRSLATAYVTDPGNPAAQSIPDDYSPRDRMGHGTAVASAAAGNANTGSIAFTGVAPKAWLGNYKLAGSPGVNDGPTDDVMIRAVEDALRDGMDVVTLSWGGSALTGALDTGAVCGNAPGAPCDPVAAAYEAAAKAGLVITIAAGNSGQDALFSGGQYPNFNSISSPSSAPSTIAVGASTNSHVMTPAVSVNAPGAPSALKAIAALPGDGDNFPSFFGANSAPLVDVAKVGSDGLACTSLPAGTLRGAFALIQRGNCPFSTKILNAQNAGAIGMIFFMADGNPLVPPAGFSFNGPTVMVSNADGTALRNYVTANPGAAVTIDTAGIETSLTDYARQLGLSPAAENQLASYSSVGPTPDGGMKPDIVATGGFDGSLAASHGLYLAAQDYDPNGDLYSTNRYAAADGTSFAAPIVAGAAALLRQAHPTWTAAQIKSALVNTAAQDISIDDQGNTVDVRSVGGGKLDAGAAMSAVVTAEPATISFPYVKAGVLPLSKPVVVTNKGSAAVTLAVAVAPGRSTSGATIAVDRSSLTLDGGASATLNLTLSGTVPSAGSYSGAVTLQGGGVSLRVPYLFLVGNGAAFNAVPLFASVQGIPGSYAGSIAIQVTDSFGVPVTGSPVSFSVSPRGSVTFQSVGGEPECSPAGSTTPVTCPTDAYGIAYAGVVLGQQVSTPLITARAAGNSFQFSAYILPQPQIKAGGVVNSATFQGPVAPGSYATIFGSNLVDPDVKTSFNGDSATTPILPLTLDAVTVSFDVPGAGISLPARLIYVNDGQINVQVPWELQGQSSAQVKVVMDELYGNPLFGNLVTVPLADYTPSLFEASGVAAAINFTQGNIVSSGLPVRAGDVIELFGNGLGPVNNPPATGEPASASPLSTTKTVPVVTIGGLPAAVSFSGLAPGFPALYQINVTVPAGVGTGAQPVTVSIGGQTSKVSTIPVRPN